MRITIAITGASGSIYAKRLIEKLISQTEYPISRLFVVMSDSAKQVIAHEIPDWDYSNLMKANPRIEILDNHSYWAQIASGSSTADTMVVVPCSMGSVGRFASGISIDLIGRAADVIIKEKRKLILCIRETPLSLIHLRNMTTLAECGATILPLSPSFYSQPSTLELAVDTVIERILQNMDMNLKDSYKWNQK